MQYARFSRARCRLDNHQLLGGVGCHVLLHCTYPAVSPNQVSTLLLQGGRARNRAQSVRTQAWSLLFRKARKLVKGRKVVEECRPASFQRQNIACRRFFNDLPGEKKEVVSLSCAKVDAGANQAFVERKQFLYARTALSLADEVRVSEAIPLLAADLLTEIGWKERGYLFDLDAASTPNALDERPKILFVGFVVDESATLLNALQCHTWGRPFLVGIGLL